MFKRIILIALPIIAILAAGLIYFFTETRSLTGIVRDADTGQAITNALVTAPGLSARTDTEGKYQIAVPRGKTELSVQADGYVSSQTQVDGDDFFARAFAVDFGLPPILVSVVVHDSETAQPIASATVQIDDKKFIADGEGIAQVRGVKTGASISALAPGYQATSVVYDGQGNFDLGLSPNQVTVTVINQYTNQPIPNLKLEAGDQTLTTDTTGRVIARRLKPGTNVRASLVGYDNASAQFSQGDLQIVLRPNTLDGVITDEVTGKPISGTLVYLGSNIVATNAKGEYHFDNVPVKTTLMLKAAAYRKVQIEVANTARRDYKLAPFLVKGIHIPFGMQSDQVRALIDMVNKTELNAIVIDVKAEKGRVAWESQVTLAKQIGASLYHGIPLSEILDRCKKDNIYCIARMPVFQDNLLATSRPAQAIRTLDGNVFTETAGQQWLNPYVTENWDYAIGLAKEIAVLGFDEIQFDYVRFPGRVGNIDYGTENTQEKRIATIAGFLARAQKELRPTGIFISADVFGLTTATDDDQNTGQRIRDLGPYLDYISPMVYPDTWVNASDLLMKGLQIPNCTEANNCPYDVIYNSYKRASEKTSTKVRLWLQAYAGRANFGVTQYRIQKKAAADTGSIGWMFWSGEGVYDPKMFDAK